MNYVYQVWDFYSMASSHGEYYYAATYAKQEDAEADAERRNESSRQSAMKSGADETYNWRRASVRRVELK